MNGLTELAAAQSIDMSACVDVIGKIRALDRHIQMRRDLHDDEQMPRLDIYGSKWMYQRRPILNPIPNPLYPRNRRIANLMNLREFIYRGLIFWCGTETDDCA